MNQVVNIPKDYEGVMGVPITFMDKYNPDQFEILGTSSRLVVTPILPNGKETYECIIIRNKTLNRYSKNKKIENVLGTL